MTGPPGNGSGAALDLPEVARSEARVIGRIGPPAGRSWDVVLARPDALHLFLLDFYARAAKALGRPAADLRVRHKVGRAHPGRADGVWHCDGVGPAVSCVVGDAPTEYLLGEYRTDDMLRPERHLHLERTLRKWRAGLADLVLSDCFTIHRRPGRTGPRLYAIAQLRPEAVTEGPTLAGGAGRGADGPRVRSGSARG